MNSFLAISAIIAGICIALDSMNQKHPDNRFSRKMQELGIKPSAAGELSDKGVERSLFISGSHLNFLHTRYLNLFSPIILLSIGGFLFSYFIALDLSPPGVVPNIFKYDFKGFVTLFFLVFVVNILIDFSLSRKTIFVIDLLSNTDPKYNLTYPKIFGIILADFLASIAFTIAVLAIFFAVVSQVFEFSFERQDRRVFFYSPASDGNIPVFFLSTNGDHVPEGFELSISAKKDQDDVWNVSTNTSAHRLGPDFPYVEAFAPHSGFLGTLWDWNSHDKEPSSQIINAALSDFPDVICNSKFQGKHKNGAYEYKINVCRSRKISLIDRVFRNLANMFSQMSWFLYTEGSYYMSANPFFLHRNIDFVYLTANTAKDEDSKKRKKQEEMLAAAKINVPYPSDGVLDDNAASLREGILRSEHSADLLPLSSLIVTSLIPTGIFFCVTLYLLLSTGVTQAFRRLANESNRTFIPIASWPLTFLFTISFSIACIVLFWIF